MEPKPININGYDTYFTECTDSTGTFLLISIPADAGKDISDITGTFVNNHLIKMIDYATTDGIRFIKAYY
jgi:hypothetical protein|nr:MAG TPA: hypothetical protein [Caudoviricetes sp.]